jgi:ATP-dependent Lhr-like helicase
VLRLPDTDAEPPGADVVVFEAAEIESLVTAELGGSAVFASRFRECAARSLLLPRRDPQRRTPLWQQRQRANQLLQVASDYGEFPVTLEAMRECLQDVFDVPGLTGLMRDLASRQVRLVEVETPEASPFARSLLFGYVGMFLYEGDAPLAERRAQALSLDSTLLAELLGSTELRELFDADAISAVAAELQRLTPDRHARGIDSVHDLLRGIGDLSTAEALARAGARPTRRPGGPLRPHTRALPRGRRRSAARPRRRRGHGRAGAVARVRARRARRVHPGRHRARVVRRRGAAHDPASLPSRVAP